MEKIKTLLGKRNAQILIGSFIRYSILFFMFKFINPWIVGAINIVISWFIWLCIASYKDKKADIKILAFETAVIAVPTIAAESFVAFLAFKHIELLGIPALSLLYLIINMLNTDDDEPRTKTDSPYEEKNGEEQSNETYSVVGEAQDFRVEYFGSDPDGNSAIEKLKGYDWNTGEPIERKEKDK